MSAIEEFHKIYYERLVWKNMRWLGVPIMKNPFDLMVYQEMLHEIRPDLIVECGTLNGGSAFFFASICDLIGSGRVVTVDVAPLPGRPEHPRITYLEGSSTSPQLVDRVKGMVRPGETVLVVLDSDHKKQHVFDEMTAYGPIVSLNSYMVVEDGNVNGHPVYLDHGEGPTEAIADFMRGNSEFMVDRNREKHLFTFNPGGYLKRVAVKR